MRTNSITPQDIDDVALQLNMLLSEDDIEWVMDNYDEYEEQDPNTNWSLIVEQMLHERYSKPIIKNKMEKVNLMYAIAEAVGHQKILCASVTIPSTGTNIRGEKVVCPRMLTLPRGYHLAQLVEFFSKLNCELNADDEHLEVKVWLEGSNSFLDFWEGKVHYLTIPIIPDYL